MAGLFAGLRAGTAGNTGSQKSRLIDRAGILHSVTHSSSWHWSSHKHSYNTPTQQTQHLPCHIVAGGKKEVMLQGNGRAASSLEGPSSKSSAQISILGCYSQVWLKAQRTVKAAFLFFSTHQLGGISLSSTFRLTQSNMEMFTSVSMLLRNPRAEWLAASQAHTHKHLLYYSSRDCSVCFGRVA